MNDIELAMRRIVREANRRTEMPAAMYFGLDFFIRYYRAIMGKTLTPQEAHDWLMANPLVTCYPGGGYWINASPMPEGANTQIAFDK